MSDNSSNKISADKNNRIIADPMLLIMRFGQQLQLDYLGISELNIASETNKATKVSSTITLWSSGAVQHVNETLSKLEPGLLAFMGSKDTEYVRTLPIPNSSEWISEQIAIHKVKYNKNRFQNRIFFQVAYTRTPTHGSCHEQLKPLITNETCRLLALIAQLQTMNDEGMISNLVDHNSLDKLTILLEILLKYRMPPEPDVFTSAMRIVLASNNSYWDEKKLTLNKRNKPILLSQNQLYKENAELREILSKRFPARRLFLITTTASIALIANLLAWFQYGTYIIHPALATIVLVGTLGFSGLAYWREKC